MKRGAIRHVKTGRLAKAIGKPRYCALGLMEALIDWAKEQCPRGNIGKYADWEIEEAVGWDDAEGTLVAILVDCGWAEYHNEHRVVIHDWYDHADDSVHMQLARAGDRFWCGRQPKLTRFGKIERERIETTYAERTDEHTDARTENARHTHGERTENAPPSPSLPPLALPSHALPSPPTREGASQPQRDGMDGRREALADAGIGGDWADLLLSTACTVAEIRSEIKRVKGDKNVGSVAGVVGSSLAKRYGVRLPKRSRAGPKLAGDSVLMETIRIKRHQQGIQA